MSSPMPTVVTELDVLRWVADVFGTAPESIGLDTARDDVPMWDSLGTLLLLAAFDETFGIVISDAEMAGMSSVRDIVAVLRAHGKLA